MSHVAETPEGAAPARRLPVTQVPALRCGLMLVLIALAAGCASDGEALRRLERDAHITVGPELSLTAPALWQLQPGNPTQLLSPDAALLIGIVDLGGGPRSVDEAASVAWLRVPWGGRYPESARSVRPAARGWSQISEIRYAAPPADGLLQTATVFQRAGRFVVILMYGSADTYLRRLDEAETAARTLSLGAAITATPAQTGWRDGG